MRRLIGTGMNGARRATERRIISGKNASEARKVSENRREIDSSFQGRRFRMPR
jgi:hypothetical protein